MRYVAPLSAKKWKKGNCKVPTYMAGWGNGYKEETKVIMILWLQGVKKHALIHTCRHVSYIQTCLLHDNVFKSLFHAVNRIPAQVQTWISIDFTWRHQITAARDVKHGTPAEEMPTLIYFSWQTSPGKCQMRIALHMHRVASRWSDHLCHFCSVLSLPFVQHFGGVRITQGCKHRTSTSWPTHDASMHTADAWHRVVDAS